MIATLPILRAIALLSPSQSCCHGLGFASLMLHSALLFCHPPNLAACRFPPTLAVPQVVLPNPGSSSSSRAELPTKFSMTRRFNMDQVPSSLDLLPTRTWGEEKETTVSSCGAGSTQKVWNVASLRPWKSSARAAPHWDHFQREGNSRSQGKAMYHEAPANLAVVVYGLQV